MAKLLPPWLPLLNRTRAGVFVVDARQRIIFWNKGAERMLGHPASAVLGRSCHEVIAGTCHGRLWCHANCRVQRKIRRGVLPSDFDLLIRSSSGRPIFANITILVASRDGGSLAVHFMRDVTYDRQNEAKVSAALAVLGSESARHERRGGLRRIAAATPPRSPQSPILRLTRREMEILALLAQGVASKAVADRLGISVLTVRKHVQSTLRRLGLHSRVAAVSFALRNGILGPAQRPRSAARM